MKKVLLLFSLALLPLFLTGTEEKPFAEFRRQAAQVKRRSPEDFALGKKLAQAMQKAALARKPLLGRSHLYFETVLWRGGRLWFSEKYWHDRSLFTNRKYFSKSRSWEKNTAVTYRLMRDYDADGCNFFANRSAEAINLDAADMSGLSPDEFKILPTVCPHNSTYWSMLDRVLKKIVTNKYVWRIGGKPVYLTYSADVYKGPAALKAFFDDVRKRSGSDLAYIVDITGNHIYLYPDTQYAVHRAVAATDLLRYFDHITDYLRDAVGVEYGVYLGKQDLTLAREYIDEVLLPLYGAACAQKPFDGKRILSLKVVSNYTNCNGSQTVYADGTRTLRGYLDLCRKYKVDLIQGFEWDEHNENTNLEPTVAKPMAYKRIFRYYMAGIKGRAPAPLEGDDLERPNLIVSTRRQLGAGEELELELLNVPDGGREPYRVTAELFDQSGKAVYRSKEIKFDPAVFGDRTLSVPTEKYPDSLFLQPRLIVDFKGKTRTYEGLPPVIVRGTASRDHSTFSTPLRNLLTAKGSVSFTEGRKVRPGIREVNISADMTFDDKLVSAEAVQDSQDIFVWDPRDEFQTADGMNRLFKFYVRTADSTRFELRLELPFAKKFDTSSAPDKPAALAPLSGTRTRKMDGNSRIDEYFIVPGTALAEGVLKVSGKRLAGKLEGKPFACSFRLADVLKTGVSSVVLPDGLQFALECDPRPAVMALELGTNRAAFSAPLLVNAPDGVTALRMVSQSGKIYWSRAHALPASGKPVPVSALSSRRGVLDFSLPESRVPHIVYDFDQPLFGNILPAAAGREFYAHIAGFLSVSTGFEGGMGAFSMPRAYVAGASQVPARRNGPAGRSLVFNGRDTQAVFFPKTAVPQRHGFTLVFDLKFDDVKKDQIIFEQRNAHSYLTGFLLRLEKGKFVLEYNFREPHKDHSPLSTLKKFETDISPAAGVRQKLVLRFDCRKVTVELREKKASFPAEGMGLWLTPSAFGGRGSERFAGELFGVRFVHSPEYR